MTTQITRQTAHEDLLRHALQGRLSEQDALLWMVLFHTHAVHLRPQVLADDWGDGQGAAVLAALTQREAASLIAALWPDRADPRADYVYWYRLYNTRPPYEALSDLPKELLPRLFGLRDALTTDPRVAAVLEED